jgi:hypothetical protein
VKQRESKGEGGVHVMIHYTGKILEKNMLMILVFNAADQLLTIPLSTITHINFLKQNNDYRKIFECFIFAKEKATITMNFDRILPNGKLTWKKGDYEGRASNKHIYLIDRAPKELSVLLLRSLGNYNGTANWIGYFYIILISPRCRYFSVPQPALSIRTVSSKLSIPLEYWERPCSENTRCRSESPALTPRSSIVNGFRCIDPDPEPEPEPNLDLEPESHLDFELTNKNAEKILIFINFNGLIKPTRIPNNSTYKHLTEILRIKREVNIYCDGKKREMEEKINLNTNKKNIQIIPVLRGGNDKELIKFFESDAMKWHCPKLYEWDLSKLVYRKMLDLKEAKRRFVLYCHWFKDWEKRYFFPDAFGTLEWEQKIRNYNYRGHNWTRIKVFRVRNDTKTKMGKIIY